jgi:ubiquinone/menaquinone biosynthesis C-methylase UbiE
VNSDNVQHLYRVRILLFLLCVVVTVFVLGIMLRVVQTFSRLELAEWERDQWQRPAEIIEALNLSPGDVVVDFGSGSGYFAVKLSSVVGARGKVLAVDIRRLPLLVLWVRAFGLGLHNITLLHGEAAHPDLPTGIADGVLIANTYHELVDPKPILEQLFRSLHSGGRLVVIDRIPRSANGESRGTQLQHHEIPAISVENDVLHAGFRMITNRDRFVSGPGNELWWLIVARRP